jgi:O-antigen/teichoic acid export membrane protein
MKSKRAIINISISILYQVLSIITGLVLPKFYIETFGSAYNGLNQTVIQIISLLGLLQAGIGAAAIQALFKPVTENDLNKINAIFNGVSKQFKKMGYFFILLMVVISIIWPILNNEKEISGNLIVVFLIFNGLSACIDYFFQGKYNILLMAYNRNYVLYIFGIFSLIIMSTLRLLILFNFANIILYQSVILIVGLIKMIVLRYYIKKNFEYLDNEIESDTLILNQRKHVLISELAGFVINSAGILIISINCGLVDASIYAVYNFVIIGILGLIGSVRDGVFSGIGQTYYSSKVRFNQVFSSFETIYLSMTLLLFSVLLIMYPSFIKLYTKGMDVNYADVYLPILFVIANLLVNLRIPAIVSINTAGHFEQVKGYAVKEAIINVVLSFILSKVIGIYGVLIGMIVGSLYRSPLLIFYSDKNILIRTTWIYIKKISLLSTPFLISIYIYYIDIIDPKNFIVWFYYSVFISIIYFIIYIIFIINLDKEGFKIIKSIFMKFKQRGV